MRCLSRLPAAYHVFIGCFTCHIHCRQMVKCSGDQGLQFRVSRIRVRDKVRFVLWLVLVLG